MDKKYCQELLKTLDKGIYIDNEKYFIEYHNIDTDEHWYLQIQYCPFCGKRIIE